MPDKPLTLANPRDIRLYDDDEKEIRKIADKVSSLTALTMLDLIRDSVHAGLPVIKDKLKPLLKE